MRELTRQQNNLEQEREDEANTRPRRQTTSDTQIKRTPSQQYGRKQRRVWSTSSITTISNVVCSPSPLSPQKKGNCGRKKIILTEFEEDSIRYQFHLLLASKQYPTTAKLSDNTRNVQLATKPGRAIESDTPR
ncbi:unnamed protein product [Rotaria sordida]|uniref:Uncharacterized protein n=1 Tax=Rotaria sordida TaxID=392033 RepID=A0A815XA67_9BILA|nr:unnamed protein product [Rotaria sordida]